jgi:KipI family sensor histidine kinase inhibitor
MSKRMFYSPFRYLPAGDSAVAVEVGDAINPAINAVIRGLAHALETRPLDGIREYIPTYRSLLVIYDPARLVFSEMLDYLKQLEERLEEIALPEPRIVEIPVVYGGEFGPDLEFVARYHHVSEEKVIALHSEREYLVYMLGFTPGFCYLGGMSEQLETPRLAEPRTCIPAGSVGIAGKQTGIYPIDSPGGWRIIGRTTFRLFDPHREPPVSVNAGDYIRFLPIQCL